MKPSARSVKRALRSCIVSTTSRRGSPGGATSALTKTVGMIPITSPPPPRAHQPKLAAAIDPPDPAFGEPMPDHPRRLDIDRIRRARRPAIDCDTLHLLSPSINAAVALALPTTPGMPAPGCVPAPTK